MTDMSIDTETIATNRELVEIETKARAATVMHWPELVRLINRLRKAEARLQEQIVFDAKVCAAKDAEIERLREILTAIAEGYPVRGENDCYVIVENPRYTPVNGEAPNLVWEKSGEQPVR